MANLRQITLTVDFIFLGFVCSPYIICVMVYLFSDGKNVIKIFIQSSFER